VLEPQPYVQAAFDKKEKINLLKAGLLILAIYLFRSTIFRLIDLFVFLLPILFYAFVWERSIHKGDRIRDILRDYMTVIPLSHAEGGKKNFIPWVTLWLVLINAFFYYGPFIITDWERRKARLEKHLI
jgi:hypothetical protein